MSTSFQKIYYDPFKNKIFLWETINGQRFYDKLDFDHVFYVEDPKNESPIKDIYGKRVIQKITSNKKTMTQIKESGVFTCETDLDPCIKFLHQRYKGVELKPEMKDFQICYLDLEVETGTSFPKPTEANFPINLISIKLSIQNKIYTFGNRPYEGKENYKCIPNEKEMLEAFIDFFNRAKVSILTGWNLDGFDIPYIINRCNKLGIEKTLSPIGKYWQNLRNGEWSIPGISVLDYMRFFKDPKFVPEKQESYSLQSICMKELGEGKLELDGFINDAYKKNWKQYVDYNIQDVLLVEKLENKKKLIEFAINIAHASLIPIDRVFSAIAIIEGQLLNYLHKNNMVMNDRKEDSFKEDLEGAYVESVVGYHEDVISYDFESLYPNMMIHYNISPETLVLYPEDELKPNLIKTPLSESDGIWYKKEKGILPIFLEENLIGRKQSKELKKKYEKEGNKELTEYYDSRQAIMKVILNSCYGCASNNYFHLYNFNCARTVTLSGQHIIKHMKNETNRYFKDFFHKDKRFFSVIDDKNKIKKDLQCIVDTDSDFFTFGEVKKKIAPEKELVEWANEFNDSFMTPFFKKLLDKYFSQFGVENKINFKIEKIISQLIVFGDKNYAAVILSNEGVTYKEPKMKVTGFSSKRSSTPSYCRTIIDEMLNNFFANPDRLYMIEEIKKVKNNFMECSIEDISFPRGITDYHKYAIYDTENYVKNGLRYESRTPIHVRASMVYNYLITKYKLPNQPVDSGAKIKYFYVHENNELKTDVVGFLGNCPEYIKQNFKVDYEQQLQVSFLNPMQKLFDVMNWGLANPNTVDISHMFEAM